MTIRSNQVFLIDDDEDLRFTIGLSLREDGLDVRAFASADEALGPVLSETPGAIFLDYRIEGMSAPDFVAKVSAAGLGDVPIVLLTGSHNIADIAAELKVFDSLAKPFDIDELVERARKALAANR